MNIIKMFKIKSVVFIVFMIIICSVFGKNHKLRSKLASNQISQTGQVRVEEKPKPEEKPQPKPEEKPEPRHEEKPKPEEKPEPKEEKPFKCPRKEHKNREEKKEGKPTEVDTLSEDLLEQEVPPFDDQYQKFVDIYNASFEEDVRENRDNLFHKLVDEEFKKADKTKDDFVDFCEFLGRLDEIAEEFEIPEEIFSEEQLKEVFDIFDFVNTDGKLDKEEFASLVQASLYLIINHFEFVEDNGLEDLYNLKEYLHEIRRILEEEDLYEFALELKYDEEEHHHDEEHIHEDPEPEPEPEDEEERFIDEEDIRRFVEGLLWSVEAPEEKREEVLSHFEGGDRVLDEEEVEETVRSILEHVAEELEQVIENIEDDIEDEVPEEFSAETSTAVLLKMKSLKKSRKMKKNLKTKKAKKVRSKKSIKMFMKKK